MQHLEGYRVPLLDIYNCMRQTTTGFTIRMLDVAPEGFWKIESGSRAGQIEN